ncbi:transcription-repair coupling factor [Sphingomonadales bacterium 56]|uniref:transcription-repair coupling factor n=1 Tax=unclassified Sphingobium TaxID=2611147 RepID=UPI00191B4C67|nr:MULTISPECIES: transcription-repair coupling factor [unclassified Sphingobium]MBY2927821.1 transcription-repair coupling factor [Sphingomonadales bacterium 56]MBY2957921.1 transcription-repair coupling factor [Sphingomonadales bacterium 58]CAD7336002.1 Transcription-repair-coupling factor [Sphingobium sp. S6]CAD7336065.1 Transcription-repair-coupling factor [Sphingobium sp. S8]
MTDLLKILKAPSPITLAGVPAGFQPWLLADIARAAPSRALFVAPDEQLMRAVADTAHYFAPEIEIVEIPAWDCLPYDRASPSLRSASARLAGLYALQGKPKGPQLVLTTLNALTQRTLTPFRVRQLVAKLAPKERIAISRLAEMLQANGYVRTDTVHDRGEFAIRGGIVDLFPGGEEQPLRLDFFGDEIETVRRFDPADQRTSGSVEGFTLLPASEALLDEETIKRFRGRYRETFGATATGDPLYQAVSDGRRLAGMEHWLPLFEERLVPMTEHLGDDTLVVLDHGVAGAAEARFEAIRDYHANRVQAKSSDPGAYRPLEPKALYLDADEWDGIVREWPMHATTPFHEPESATVLDFEVDGPRDFAPERAQNANVYEAVGKHIASLQQAKKKVVIASYSGGARERLSGLLVDHGLKRVAAADSWQEALGIAAGGSTVLTVLPLDHGFTAPDVAVLTEQDMLGDRLVRRAKRKKNADAFLQELATLSPGDLVVHMDHGIGRYEGLTQIPVAKAAHDCVALEYAGGDKLYVPVENLEVLSRYGSDSEGVSLDRLGGEAWQRRKAKMKERIREIAGELLKTAAERALRAATVAEPDSAGYPAFVDRFPYQETEDQDRAIMDVVEDLGAGRPMDRLVCGDVGFGKTEVALRAAFVAAMAGMQVVVICPTTLLARQHHMNFEERFRGFPVNIGRLSRLVPDKEAKAVKAGLADGTIDIVVGTHALLAKGLEFKRLGLVIVDEEQRFGVTHKERLKSLKTDVHVLTLTATPIPRTLQMAMSGLRELSVIQTPPVDRLAVRTYIMPWDGVVIREALLREHYRGGQSFFVVPRISDLTEVEEYLRTEVPEVKPIVAHGQMAAGEVEERMSAFYDKRYDVLLSTTIVESGLDIPSANTLIIHRADRFGLAQLYQLRGRVGRSKTRAYAYFTTPANRVITETAEKRLKVLSDLDTLGAGFQLASHDLDIRGAGNLVGDEQSGHIKEVGFELYQSMLEDAILEAKAGGAGIEKRESFSPQITVDAPILIPEDYVPDLDLRMGLYRRLNEVEDRQGLEAFAAELIDRFGKLPAPTQNLFKIIEIKQNCVTANISKIDVGPKGALVSFFEDRFPKPEGLVAYIQRLNGVARLRPDSKVVVNRAWADPAARLNGALQLSKGLAKAAS